MNLDKNDNKTNYSADYIKCKLINYYIKQVPTIFENRNLHQRDLQFFTLRLHLVMVFTTD